jgi:hypothetical protein
VVGRTPTLHWFSSLVTDARGRAVKGSPENKLGFVYSESDGLALSGWSLTPASLARWTVAAFHSWTKAYHRVKAVFPHNRTILFSTPAKFAYGDYPYCSKNRWYHLRVTSMAISIGIPS